MFKKSILAVATLTMAASVFTGCSSRTSSPSGEMINLKEVDFKKVAKMKKGTACHSNFLFIPLGSDDSTLSAAANAGVSRVHFVENSTMTLIHPWLYSDRCKTVFGE